MAKRVNTTREAIHALGGYKVVARITKSGENAVSNWHKRGFPAITYPVLSAALREKGLLAPRTLWRQPKIIALIAAE